jgi:ribosomal protein S18 acetylase RimI-like enzyme
MDQLAGCLTAFWDAEQNRNLSEKIGYTEYIFVCPQWRRKGLASAMISKVLDFLKQNGMRFAQLQVRTDNRDALNLYEKLGFVIVQESGIYTRTISGT